MVNTKKKLEKKLAKFVGVQNALLFSSCRNALHHLLLDLNKEEKIKDEIIIQNFICDSLPQSIKNAGNKVVYANVNQDTFNLTSSLVLEKITPNTKAVVFVHTYGNPNGIEEVAKLCKEKGIILIEDIAHALGANYNSKNVGTFGDYAIYSLTKQMINIGGGVLLSNNNLSNIKNRNNQSAAIMDYPKRFMASLYETRGFWLSKLLIDFVRKKADLKLANAMSPHDHCTSLEAWIALKQLNGLNKKIKKRERNYNYLKKFVKTQNVNSGSSYNYLSLIFPNNEMRDKMVDQHFLCLPPWPGSNLSDKIAFIPNNPGFSKKSLRKLGLVYQNFYKPSSSNDVNE
jgi:perosamine synthetase